MVTPTAMHGKRMARVYIFAISIVKNICRDAHCLHGIARVRYRSAWLAEMANTELNRIAQITELCSGTILT